MTSNSKIHEDTWINPDTVINLDCIPKKGWGMKVKNSHLEKFWINYQYTDHNSNYIGIVDNHLVNKCGYDYGDYIKFNLENVYEINTPEKRITQINASLNRIDRFVMKYDKIPTLKELDHENLIFD